MLSSYTKERTKMKKDNTSPEMGHKSDKNPTKQVRIDRQWHTITKLYGIEARRSLRSLLEEGLSYVIPQKFTIDNTLDDRPGKDP